MTLTEKIVNAHAAERGGRVYRVGDFVQIRPTHVMTHDNTAAVMSKFKSIGAKSVFDRQQPVFALDHDVQSRTPQTLGMFAAIEAFAKTHGIDFYPPGSGIGHQIMVERGYVTPGSLVVASDSHSNMYGALGCLGTPVVRTDAAAIWATGTTWWRVPPVARVRLSGRLREGVSGKDVIVALCGLVNRDEVLNHAVEFVGPGVASLSVEERMTIANMTTEWGSLTGVFPVDERLEAWLRERNERSEDHGRDARATDGETLRADDDARYDVEITLDLSRVPAMVAGPNDVKVATGVDELAARRVAIQKAYLLSCVNGRLEDLRSAARVMHGKKVAAGVEFYLAAASAEIQRRAEEEGVWGTLVEAGARVLPSGCGPCIGLGTGLVGEHEVAISATNRNFKGRMGSPSGQVYLGSPAVVAASAVAGYITGPEDGPRGGGTGVSPVTVAAGVRHRRDACATDGQELVDGFPRVLRGRAFIIPADDLNTDGIYAGKWTYRNDLTPEQMAKVAFENYEPTLAAELRAGDILFVGRNFGCGSSREQACAAIQAAAVQCIIAASAGATFERNAFNNGMVCLEAPEIADAMIGLVPSGAKFAVGPMVEVDFEAGRVRVVGEGQGTQEKAGNPPPGPLPLGGGVLRVPGVAVQALIAAGGVEKLVASQIGTLQEVAS